MLKDYQAFSGYSTNDIASTNVYYKDVLKLETEVSPTGLTVHLAGGGHVFIYPRQNHEPASFTVLNFIVPNIDEAVAELSTAGVTFEKYAEMANWQDEKGISRGRAAGMGPDIAWFKDPAGNTLAVLQND